MKVKLQGTVAVVPVHVCCLKCGLVSVPADSIGYLATSALHALRAHFAIGIKGNADTFELPDWGPLRDPDPLLQIKHRLINAWSSLSDSDLTGQIRVSLGLPSMKAKIPAANLPGVPAVYVDGAIVTKIVRRTDPDHARYAPLIRDTVDHPLEVWFGPHDGKADQVRFLRKYLEGGNLITHMVTADAAEGYLTSAYTLSNIKRAHKQRDGIPMLIRWSL